MNRVIALVATIPLRRRLCERLLAELLTQTRPPDGLLLRLDGYGDSPAPATSLPVIAESRSAELSGPGQRWIAALGELGRSLDRDDLLVCIDDDAMLMQAPGFVAALALAAELGGGAAAAMGRDLEGKPAPPGAFSRGQLIHGAGLGLTVRAHHLEGLPDFAERVRAASGIDMLDRLGDDDALLSAHLWTRGIPIRHATTGNVFQAPNSRASSQTAKRHAQGDFGEPQKLAIQKATGWPYKGSK